MHDKFYEIFNTKESINEVIAKPKHALSSHNTYWPDNIISLPLPEGKMGTFKAINSSICDHRGKTEYIIGKLIDVSEEVAEKKELLVKSQIDELTGLYNAATIKELIVERIEKKKTTMQMPLYSWIVTVLKASMIHTVI